MSRIKYLAIFAALAVVPQSTLANCSEFVGYNAEGNWAADIQVQVDDALGCEMWTFELDQTTLVYAQRYIAHSALMDMRPDEAMQIADDYFDTAVARYDRAVLRFGNPSLLTEEGIFLSGLKTRVQQIGFLAADVESTQHPCDSNQSLITILERVHEEIDAEMERSTVGAEEARMRTEQQLREVPLEQWQQNFPNAVTMDDIRNDPYIRDILEPDLKERFFERLNRRYFSLLNNSSTAENSTVRMCLVEAFEAIPEVAELTPAQRLWKFPGISKFAYRLRNEP
ncbi:hypothetical protein [Octadecabacter ascidiaceicola]|uniref:Uncharacterized protein n=1 Tax=Octadecabacter ascidiaceicola TaxID=1655543 RepID=A0A238JPM2_9RHOB|nr:hypothetical protein [Octadecabacter ascidiaceicola]SMX31812.1 hypothetical protein OCA8868_00532 [Octadecabacter ascidiaceicola]